MWGEVLCLILDLQDLCFYSLWENILVIPQAYIILLKVPVSPYVFLRGFLYKNSGDGLFLTLSLLLMA